MTGNFKNCLAVTLAHEGGWSDHPSDPGGATMKGITLATYSSFKPGATKTQLRNISNKDVETIYRRQYWDRVNGDSLATGVDLATFDAGVNSGPTRARQWLMASIGGPDHETVKKLCARRLSFMRSLAIWNTFGRGWSNRVAAVEAKGVAWALAAASDNTAIVKEKLNEEASKAKSQARKQTGGAAGAGTGGATAGGANLLGEPFHADQIAGFVLGGFLAAGLVLAAILIIRAIIQKQRARAYEAEARAIEDMADMQGLAA